MNAKLLENIKDFNIQDINFGLKPFLSSVLILVFSFLMIKLIMYLTTKIIQITKFNEQREKTMKSVVDSISAYFIMTLAVLSILSEFGFIKKATVLTGAGIITLVAGFGAQNLIKDIINGFFILFERQMKVGDFVAINEEYYGIVEEIGLRATALREWSLKKIYIPNGEIKILKNYFKEKARVIIEIIIPFEEDFENTQLGLTEVCSQINENYKDRLYKVGNTTFGEFDIVGPYSIDGKDGGSKFILTGVVFPRDQWFVRYRAHEIILQVFKERNIKIGYPKIWYNQYPESDD